MDRKQCLYMIQDIAKGISDKANSVNMTEETYIMEGDYSHSSLQFSSLETIALMSGIETQFNTIIDFDVWFIQIKDIIDFIVKEA